MANLKKFGVVWKGQIFRGKSRRGLGSSAEAPKLRK